jgi:hypothetical protein
VRCKGCSQWHDVDGNLQSIDPSAAAQRFAYGMASKGPAQPANNRSTFNVHSSFGNYKLDLTQGQNVNFDKLVAANLIQDVPPTPSSAPVPKSSSKTLLTTLSTSALSSTVPQPTYTGVPSKCAGVSALAFPNDIAHGWKATKVAGGLTQPRGLVFDTANHLLVVQNGLGVTVHEIGPDGCFASSKTLITQRNLNHGIVLSKDGSTLFASSATSKATLPGHSRFHLNIPISSSSPMAPTTTSIMDLLISRPVALALRFSILQRCLSMVTIMLPKDTRWDMACATK